MLINCPRCGFSQPKDRYCASCGVDMENFTPNAPTQMEKLVGMPFFNIALVLALTGGIIGYIRYQQSEELKARIELLSNGPVVLNQASQSPQNLTVSLNDSQELTNSAGPSNEANQSVNSPGENTSNSPETSSSTTEKSTGEMTKTNFKNFPENSKSSNENPSAANQNSQASESSPGSQSNLTLGKIGLTRAIMIYAEIDRSIVRSWLSEMRTQPYFKNFDSVSLGILPQLMQKLRQPGIKILQQTDARIQQSPVSTEWMVGTHKTGDAEVETGLQFSMNVIDQKDGVARGDLEVLRAFRDPPDSKSIEKVSYGGAFEMPIGSGFIIRGLLPQRLATDIDDDLNPDSFLSIFKSKRYLSGESEFIFILDFDSSHTQKQ